MRRYELKQVYAYLVLLMSIIILIVALTSLYHGIVALLFPESNRYYTTEPPVYPEGKGIPSSTLPEEIIQAEKEKQANIQWETEKNRAYRNIFSGTLVVILALGLAQSHRRLAGI